MLEVVPGVRNIEFSIKVEDINIPIYCPVLDIPLFFTDNKITPNTPSVDRINNECGYISRKYKSNIVSSK